MPKIPNSCCNNMSKYYTKQLSIFHITKFDTLYWIKITKLINNSIYNFQQLSVSPPQPPIRLSLSKWKSSPGNSSTKPTKHFQDSKPLIPKKAFKKVYAWLEIPTYRATISFFTSIAATFLFLTFYTKCSPLIISSSTCHIIFIWARRVHAKLPIAKALASEQL